VSVIHDHGSIGPVQILPALYFISIRASFNINIGIFVVAVGLQKKATGGGGEVCGSRLAVNGTFVDIAKVVAKGICSLDRCGQRDCLIADFAKDS
jgi:hypothetical protein